MKIKFCDFLNESVEYNEKPKIFKYTSYRLPTENELFDINSYNLSSKEIFNGFCYTIVGRGIMDDKNKHIIIQSIKMLCDLYPENMEYNDSLKMAENIKPKHIN